MLNYPALLRGDDGDTPQIDLDTDFTPLDYDSETPSSVSWEITDANTYKLHISLKEGAPGANGDTVLNASDFDDPAAGKMIVLDSDASTFVLQYQKVGDWFYPATVLNAPTGNPTYTIAQIPVPPQNFDWRPEVSGQQLVVPTGSDLAVDILARLNDETGGNIVARAIGPTGMGVNIPTHVLSSGAPWAARTSADYDKVAQGVAATIFIRVERRSGSETFSTSGTNGFFKVRPDPIPS